MKNKKQDSLDQALDLLLENEEDLSNVFKEDGLLTKRLVEKMLNSELESHLDYGKYHWEENKNNFRSGNSQKRIITENGELNLEISRDRNGSFEPT